MLFNSWQFAVFLPIVFALYWLLPHRCRWALLLAASYYFYMSWNAKYIILILFTTAASYCAALLLERSGSQARKRAILAVTLFICLGVLGVFKYFNFFSQSLSALLESMSIHLHPVTLQLLLPVGISFYTFQTLSYVIDVYRGEVKAERHFGIYATFISFFPQLVAGPIERTRNLLPQIKAEHHFSYCQAVQGLRVMVWGFFKKMVIADNLAVYVDLVYDNVHSFHGFALVLASVFFAIQIYCDFSGYSDIARGTAKLMGIELMENFRSPYFSTSVREFWSRWHISLSSWFRDYVYIPLGGNRVKKLRHWANLLITFLVSGLWHGANWTFVVWGGIHGAAQIAEDALGIKNARSRRGGVWLLRAGIMFVFVTLAWVFFRAQNLPDGVYVIIHMTDGMLRPVSYLYNGFIDMGIGRFDILSCCLFYFLPLAAYDLVSICSGRDASAVIAEKNRALQWAFYIMLALFILFFSPKGVAAEFVYFQF